MKKLIYLLIGLTISLGLFAQKTPTAYNNALTEMKAVKGTQGTIVGVNGLVVAGDDNPGWYRWDATSTATDDGFKTISVAGVTTGRWLRVGNSNTIRGNAKFSGVTLTSSYTVNYNTNGSALPFTPLTVLIIPRSANAAALSYTTNVTNTSFTIVFLTVPIVGTNNIEFDWVAIKQ